MHSQNQWSSRSQGRPQRDFKMGEGGLVSKEPGMRQIDPIVKEKVWSNLTKGRDKLPPPYLKNRCGRPWDPRPLLSPVVKAATGFWWQTICLLKQMRQERERVRQALEPYDLGSRQLLCHCIRQAPKSYNTLGTRQAARPGQDMLLCRVVS
jgi:hypothetical protein